MSQLPINLGGYQNVRDCMTEPGDLIVSDDGCSLVIKGRDDGRKVTPEGALLAYPEFRIYRKIDVPRNTDHGDPDQMPDVDEIVAVEPVSGALIKQALSRDTTVAGQPKAKTYDDGKAPLAYVPWAAVDAMAFVQAYGLRKYGTMDNYRLGMEVGRNLSCAIRHIRDYMNGHDKDHESGQNPLAHAMCRIAFVLQNLADGTAIDDRYKPAA